MADGAFHKQVKPAKPRLRLGFVVALLVAVSAGVVALLLRKPEKIVEVRPSVSCSALDAAERIRDPKMTDAERVTCLAIAGKIDDARMRIRALSETDRATALQMVFGKAHPIADRGYDESAGPIMALVVEFWPENYMAMFHAGMAEFALGHDEVAKSYLDRFLDMYAPHDVWRGRAEKALSQIEVKAPLDQREAHFRE